MIKLNEEEESVRMEIRDYFKRTPHLPKEDVCCTVADAQCPIYVEDLAELLRENHDFLLVVPSLGPAMNGDNTPFNLALSNIYEHYYQVAEEEYDRLLDDENEGQDTFQEDRIEEEQEAQKHV